MAALDVMVITRSPATGARRPSTRVPQFAQNAPGRPDWQMFWIVKHGVRYSGMAAWDGEIPDEKIWQMVTFLSRLRNLPPDVEADWHQSPVEKSP